MSKKTLGTVADSSMALREVLLIVVEKEALLRRWMSNR
jgi:hypothetical protein